MIENRLTLVAMLDIFCTAGGCHHLQVVMLSYLIKIPSSIMSVMPLLCFFLGGGGSSTDFNV